MRVLALYRIRHRRGLVAWTERFLWIDLPIVSHLDRSKQKTNYRPDHWGNDQTISDPPLPSPRPLPDRSPCSRRAISEIPYHTYKSACLGSEIPRLLLPQPTCGTSASLRKP